MKITIFTPTYNRGSLLEKLYNSIGTALKNVSHGNTVEWLIVDDGSTDCTGSVVNKIISECKDLKLQIIYHRKENGGKHTAFNIAIEKCSGDLLVCIDDDDLLTSNSLSEMLFFGKKFENSNIGGFVGRAKLSDGTPLGGVLPVSGLISNTIEIRDVYRYSGEPEVFYAQRLKEFRFPVFENEFFLTEAYLFDKFSVQFPFVYLDSVWMVKEYLVNGLTDKTIEIRVKNPVGAEAYYYQRFTLCKGFFPKLRAVINRQRFQRCITDVVKKRRINFYEVMACPFSLISYLFDRKRIHKL